METFTQIYASPAQAERTVQDLETAGVLPGEISLVAGKVTPNEDDDEIGRSRMIYGAGIGATAGGIAGLLTGLDIFAVPGLSSMASDGWLGTTIIGVVIGAVGGSMIGTLFDARSAEPDEPAYARAGRPTGTSVTVKTEKSAEQIRPILERHTAPEPLKSRRD